MEYPPIPRTKRAKKLAKRKERRRFVKWLKKNGYFYTWYRVQRRHEKITKQVYYRYFLGCRFLHDGNCLLLDDNLPEIRCKCAIYYKYPQNLPQ